MTPCMPLARGERTESANWVQHKCSLASKTRGTAARSSGKLRNAKDYRRSSHAARCTASHPALNGETTSKPPQVVISP